MKIIKLDAIDSTNSFLKDLSVKSKVDDFTVVVTSSQTLGRGQMNTKWESEAGKNLTFSVFIKLEKLHIEAQTYLNFAIAVSLFEALSKYELPKLAVKWPNDILSDRKKICGILIENSLKGFYIESSVVGIGVNVNQDYFTEALPNAVSIKNIINEELDLDTVLKSIIENLKKNIVLLKEKKFSLLEEKYLQVLYKKNVPSMFKNTQNVIFMGKIIGVNTSNGKLQIAFEDETISEFDLKEVSFL